MIALVGYTGFVGSNIYAGAGREIEKVYNSKNIKEAYGTKPDMLIYAGVRAEKYLASHAPQKDMELIIQAKENITNINPKRLVLISTVDVFKIPKLVDEDSEVDTEGLHAYGYNRYQLEQWVREMYQDVLIIRLPGLFGKNIKKNFIYDCINVIPFMLEKVRFERLTEKDPEIKNFYSLQDNGFYQVNVSEEEKEGLKKKFLRLGFSALNFTDSRSVYQFYNLAYLWKDIQIALKAGITLWHPATEPISAGELYEFLTGERFVNELKGIPADYDYRTIYNCVFGGSNGYVSDKSKVMNDIKNMVKRVEGK